ncbi:MAG: RDD family protein [Bacteroidetes bacterium]|nr:RDD family protein [Bacteroidota bacterium]
MKVQIQTSQNVDIEYDIATVGDRIAAGVIDMLVLTGYMMVIGYVVLPLLGRRLSDEGLGTVAVVILILLYLLMFLYPLLCEVFMDGQSVGKKAMQIKVVRLDGGQATLSAYLIRWLVGLVEVRTFFGAIALASCMITRQGQRVGDIAAGTTVVKVKRAVMLSQTIFAKVDDDYQPTFENVSLLNDRDIAIIKEVITSRERAGNPVVLGTLARKVKEVMEVSTDLPALKFLRTVVKDYNFYAGRV